MVLFKLVAPSAHIGGVNKVFGQDWNDLINTLTGGLPNLITLTGGLTMSGSNINVPTTASVATFALDASGGTTITLTTNSVVNLTTGANNFGGMIIISETNFDGGCAVFLAGGSMFLLGQSTAIYSITQGTASKINVYATAGVISIENKNATTAKLQIMTLRTRSSM